MMDKKKIEKAADDYAAMAIATFVNGDFSRHAIADAFEAGAKWRVNSVWHDAKDIPAPYKPILVVRDDGSHSVNMFHGNVESLPASFKRWTYIDDLLPDGGREGV